MYRKDIPLEERLILALDVPSVDEARSWVRSLDGIVRFYKVGLQLFLAGHFSFVDELVESGKKVFLDLKLFDIPNTVAKAMEQINLHGVTFTTVHAESAILKAAVEAAPKVGILAVTVLTSMDQEDLKAIGAGASLEDIVIARASLAARAGCFGVVASGKEAHAIRRTLGDSLVIVTPGVRPASSSDRGDQKRVVTPEEAVKNGADYIVVGRPVLRARDPLGMVEKIMEELKQSLD
ncbi:orotidine-5'-phosphate decarboxylase [Thermodesulforhabdus norvegica]|uniref:Orotidine 5'-phosphate decarboxylase n=1 Tax=Thermodesulforhabdus norvegica TaxID=39841 RepID=A0A1I4WAN7_9BACT|nr:orotidine-5'-phosphate decarboxylase [Thermodesulforhabdus norvegica]SFN10443.1 orotidine-5'-phosphate decarboxylase [Thermodesulforhabdus norvegica]